MFAGPRFRFAAPLGTGLAALGLAGLFAGTLAGLPLGAGGAASVASPAVGDGRSGAAAEEPATAAPGATAAAQELAPVVPGATAAPSAMDELAGRANGSAPPTASAAPGAALAPVTGTGPTPAAPPAGLPDVAMADSGPTIPMVTLVSAVAVVAGLALLAARLLGRRLTRAR